MALHKTTELIGRPLDYAVCLALGSAARQFVADFRPSTNGTQTLELMNARPVRLARYGSRPEQFQCVAEIDRPHGRYVGEGPTLEIAFCRVLVLADVGTIVEVPDGL